MRRMKIWIEQREYLNEVRESELCLVVEELSSLFFQNNNLFARLRLRTKSFQRMKDEQDWVNEPPGTTILYGDSI